MRASFSISTCVASITCRYHHIFCFEIFQTPWLLILPISVRYKERVRLSVSYQSRNEKVGSGTPIKFNSLYHHSEKKSLQIRFFGFFALESIRVSYTKLGRSYKWNTTLFGEMGLMCSSEKKLVIFLLCRNSNILLITRISQKFEIFQVFNQIRIPTNV